MKKEKKSNEIATRSSLRIKNSEDNKKKKNDLSNDSSCNSSSKEQRMKNPTNGNKKRKHSIQTESTPSNPILPSTTSTTKRPKRDSSCFEKKQEDWNLVNSSLPTTRRNSLEELKNHDVLEQLFAERKKVLSQEKEFQKRIKAIQSKQYDDVFGEEMKVLESIQKEMTTHQETEHSFLEDQERHPFLFSTPPCLKSIPKFSVQETNKEQQFALIYECMDASDEELSFILWNKLILHRVSVQLPVALENTTTVPQEEVFLPVEISKWLFSLAAFHPDPRISYAAFSNLSCLGTFNDPLQGWTSKDISISCHFPFQNLFSQEKFAGWSPVKLEWKPCLQDFLNVFHHYGMQPISKEEIEHPKTCIQRQEEQFGDPEIQELYAIRLHHVLNFMLMCLRSKNPTCLLHNGQVVENAFAHHLFSQEDAFSLIILLIRLVIDPLGDTLVSISMDCVRELLELFKSNQWKDIVQKLCLTLAGKTHGLYRIPKTWVKIARYFPSSLRGNQIKASLSFLILQNQRILTPDDLKQDKVIFPVHRIHFIPVAQNHLDELLKRKKKEGFNYYEAWVMVSLIDVLVGCLHHDLVGADFFLLYKKMDRLTLGKGAIHDDYKRKLTEMVKIIEYHYYRNIKIQ